MNLIVVVLNALTTDGGEVPRNEQSNGILCFAETMTLQKPIFDNFKWEQARRTEEQKQNTCN